MNRPRPSVLQLFDPLSTRDAHSPESDKENSLPDSDFFPHWQTHVKHLSPVRLTRRLVEVGDVTVDLDGVGDGDGLQDGDGAEEDEDDENDTIGLPAPATPRTPLGDVTFDRERTPMRSKMYRRKPNVSPVVPNPARDDCAFASVVDTTNASDATLDSNGAPSVVIFSPDDSPSSSNGDALSTFLATPALVTPTGSLIADTTLAFPTPSEASTSLIVPNSQPSPLPSASFNPDRSSADLHSSFAWHMDMNSAESSFDLLNDKISFLGHSDEDSYYVEGGLGPVSEQEDSNGSDAGSNTHAELGRVAAPDNSLSRSGSPLLHLLEIPQEPINTADQHRPASPAIPLEPSTIPSVAPVFVAPPTRQISPIPTSLPEPPTLVPALKIVKRKATPGSETAVGTQSPADGAQSPEPVPSRATRIASSSIPSVARSVTEGQGPWRVPISNSDKEKIAATARYHKPIPGTTVAGPRRVPVVQAPAPAQPAAKPSQVAQLTGLKRPLRLIPPNGSTSGLPRAVGGTSSGSGSRLPMPKSRIATAGGTGIGLPRRRVP
ncbi:hypothetical protein DFH09DRAFT_1289419 [Mycena vulgaris]|nr:hypothetical protein DFH09DRAFT_1289419 [Mycena vulgaris]